MHWRFNCHSSFSQELTHGLHAALSAVFTLMHTCHWDDVGSVTVPHPQDDEGSFMAPHPWEDVGSIMSPHPQDDVGSIMSPDPWEDVGSFMAPTRQMPWREWFPREVEMQAHWEPQPGGGRTSGTRETHLYPREMGWERQSTDRRHSRIGCSPDNGGWERLERGAGLREEIPKPDS